MKMIKKIVLVVIICGLGALYAYGNWTDEIYDTDVNSASYGNIGQVMSGDVIEQPFKCPENGLHIVDIRLSTFGQECRGTYKWELRNEKSGDVVRTGNIDLSKIREDVSYPLSFNTIKDSKGNKYVLRIEGESLESEQGITVLTTDCQNAGEELTLDDKPSGRVAVVDLQQEYFSVETLVVFVGLMFYLVFFTLFLMRIFK